MKRISLFIFLIITTVSFGIAKKLISLPERVIQINDQKLIVEIADKPQSHKRGLMFRKSLFENQGMLFIFEKSEILDFWMKNTYIPLDIGFFDKKRALIEIHSMKPHSLEITTSSKKAKYALEVREGWFKRNKIKPGNRFFFVKKHNSTYEK